MYLPNKSKSIKDEVICMPIFISTRIVFSSSALSSTCTTSWRQSTPPMESSAYLCSTGSYSAVTTGHVLHGWFFYVIIHSFCFQVDCLRDRPNGIFWRYGLVGQIKVFIDLTFISSLVLYLECVNRYWRRRLNEAIRRRHELMRRRVALAA
jgi:hypothetical protein